MRLNMIVEGQTEKAFVERILQEYLNSCRVSTSVRCVRTGRKNGHNYRGGVLSYQQVKYDIGNWLKQDRNDDVRFTTMFDLYALPECFPGYEQAKRILDPHEKVHFLEEKFYEDMNDSRLIAYIQLHEFEALLLADPFAFRVQFIAEDDAIGRLAESCSGFPTPEHINDGRETAPSKRVIQSFPNYARIKVVAGPLIAQEIGISTLRNKCPHFGSWIDQLSDLSTQFNTLQCESA